MKIKPSGDSEYSLPVFSRVVLCGGSDLLWREVVLGELAPDSLLLRQNSEVLAGLGRGFDISRIAQAQEDLPSALGRQIRPLRLLLLVRLQRLVRYDPESSCKC